MRTTLKQSFARVLALGCLAALCVTACTDHDTSAPQGTALLQLASVSVKGVEVAHTRAAAHTRANVTTEDNKGFTGIRKSSFAESDALSLALTTGSSSTTTVVATLGADNLWTLSKTYFTAGTALTATHTPALGTDMTYADVLTATVNPLPADGSKLTLELTHVNALIEVTPPAGLTVSDVRVHTTFAGTPEELKTATEVNAAGANVYRTIARPATLTDVATLTAVSLTMSNGLRYTAPVASTPQLDANKRYPVALTFKGDALTATVGTTSLDWGAGTDQDLEKNPPAGYDRYIATPEELAKFAKAVNDDVAGTGARIETVLQTADIDLSTLTTDPTAYDATAENWVPIGKASSTSFKGKYNGNGYTISNMKMVIPADATSQLYGLFGHILGTRLTGIQIRDCHISTATTMTSCKIGALTAVMAPNNIITLCSATGIINVTGTESGVGGLIGDLPGTSGGQIPLNHINRISVDVDITAAVNKIPCGFIGGGNGNTQMVGCIASGDVTSLNTDRGAWGFSIAGYSSVNFCISSGKLTSSAPTNSAKSAFGSGGVYSSLATQDAYSSFSNTSISTDRMNVSIGTVDNLYDNFTAEVAPGDAYDILIRNNYATRHPVKTLHWSAEEGYTLTEVERTWSAAGGIWKNNPGQLPTLNFAYEGDEPVTP